MVLTLVGLIRNEKPATDEYPLCKTAQTHPDKLLEGYVQNGNWECFTTTYKMKFEEVSKHRSACGIEFSGIEGD
jgi:hypothetical protein